jgi:hypothetical protein
MHSNALIYSGYAITATLAVQMSEQWQDQPMNARMSEGDNNPNEESHADRTRWKYSWQFRNGDDPDLMPMKDPSEPYYNLAISAYRDSPQAELLRKRSTSAHCQSAEHSDVHLRKIPDTQVHECTFNIDLSRVAGMMLYSCCFNGPANVLLYPFYHRVFGATSAGVNRSVLFDQLVYMPFVAIPLCWYLNGFAKKWAMRDPRLDDTKERGDGENQQSPYSIGDFLVETTYEMKERWVSTVLMTMAIWIPAESINMRFTPMHLRGVLAGAVGVCWTTGMAAWTHLGSRSLTETSIESIMKSSMESRMESSMESGMSSATYSPIEAWAAIKDLLARVADTSNI